MFVQISASLIVFYSYFLNYTSIGNRIPDGWWRLSYMCWNCGPHGVRVLSDSAVKCIGFFLFGICLFLFSGLMECGKRAIKTIRYWKNSAFFKNNWDLIAFADLKNKINAKFVLLLCVEREILLPKVLEKPCCVDPINYTFPRTH